MKIGLIAGNFDVIHPGYITMFDEIKSNCDQIIVLLHTNPTIERPEKCKPVLTTEERRNILSSLRQVDEVCTYTYEYELKKYLEYFHQQHNDDTLQATYIRFLGDDYIDKPFTGDDLNFPVHYLSRSHGWSTTKFKQMIADQMNKQILIKEQ